MGEQEYPVPPLVHEEGVGFFLARARAVKPDFQSDEAVSEICRRLDDLPLALELAAARVKALSSGQILERLERRLPLLTGGARDLPERQRTLRATIQWSYELLTPAEQRLFARLAVFSGGCTLEAAEDVAEADLDTLQSLVDKSLLRHTEDRFWMLETIREYAAERLDDADEGEELRRSHADHFQALAERAEPYVHRDSLEWVDRLEQEHDNIRAALDWLETSGHAERVVHLVGALWRFWYLKSHLTEGRRRLEDALGTDGPATAAQAKLLTGAAVMALNLGDTSPARMRAEQALAMYRAVGDDWGAAYATMMMGTAAAEGGDVAGGQPLIAESVRLFEALGDRQYALIARTNLAWMTGELGDAQREELLHLENLDTARDLGNEGLQAEALAQLALFARDRGEFEDAKAKLREAIVLDDRRGNPQGVAINLGRLASVLCRAGDALTAARFVSSSEALTEQLGAETPWWAARRNAETLTLVRTALDEAAVDEALKAGRRLTLDEAVALALDS
jgi:tetratricopeptide (TPR) repeat protein